MKLKKPKFWDYKKPNFISDLLLPISKLFELFLNFIKRKRIKFEKIKTICVGNIYLGGTGKTSTVIEIKKILDEKKIKSCFIKKQYSNQIDEQRLLEKFGKVFINKSRIEALKIALSENYKVAIFDDGLQDKNISYDISFVCFNKKNFIGNGRVIPAGPLREPLSKVKEYKNILFTGNDEDNKKLKEILNKNFSNLNFYDSKYQPLNLKQLGMNQRYVVFSGIGNHGTFVDMLKNNSLEIIKDFEFPDHYNYSENDIGKIIKFASKTNAKILTTQKDYLRLSEKLQSEIYFIKINLEIINLENFTKKIINLTLNENN